MDPMKTKKLDVTEFNQKVSPDEFEAGEFGTLDIGEAGEEGDYINFMAQGCVTPDGLAVYRIAILGGNSGAYAPEEDEPPVKKKANKVLNKITKGADDEEI